MSQQAARHSATAAHVQWRQPFVIALIQVGLSLGEECHNCKLVTESSLVRCRPPLCTYREANEACSQLSRAQTNCSDISIRAHRRIFGAGINPTLDGPSDLGEVATRTGAP